MGFIDIEWTWRCSRPRKRDVMVIRLRVRVVLAMLLAAGSVFGGAVAAEEAIPLKDLTPADLGASPARPEKFLLDAIAKDLRLNLWTRPDETMLRVPLASSEWSLLKGLQPYAALNPRTLRSVIDGAAALAPPDREYAEDPWKGLGVGAGIKWRLSDRLDLYGQYQFMTLPGGSAPSASPFLRPDVEASPSLKGGFSIHF
jgi:hypothetical protein